VALTAYLPASLARHSTPPPPSSLPQHLLGAKAGESRKFRVRLPEDYRIELWQGMECDVEVSLKELFSWTLPEVRSAAQLLLLHMCTLTACHNTHPPSSRVPCSAAPDRALPECAPQLSHERATSFLGDGVAP
jgi:hypothetical protein